MNKTRDRETKIHLLKMLFSNEITKDEFNSVCKFGLQPPILFEGMNDDVDDPSILRNKEIESLTPIYNKLGYNPVKLIFCDLSKL